MIWRVGGLCVALLVMPLVVVLIRDRPTEREGLHYLTDDGSARHHHMHNAGTGLLTWREVVTRKNFWLLVFIYLPIMAVYGGVGQNLAPYATSLGSLSPFAIAKVQENTGSCAPALLESPVAQAGADGSSATGINNTATRYMLAFGTRR
jgi:hypothetical protein